MRQNAPLGSLRPILTIDCGSSSLRVTEVSIAAGIVPRELERARTPWTRSGSGSAEIDLATLDSLLARLLVRADRELSAHPAAIAVTAVLGWVPLNERGDPTGNAITYADRRATPVLGKLRDRLPRFSERAGRPLTAELLLPIDVSLAGRSRPATWTSLKDYILRRLGADPGVDEIHGAYSGFYDGEALAAAGRSHSPFAAIVPADSVCGTCRGPGNLADVPLVRGTSDGSAGFYAITAIRGAVPAGEEPRGERPAPPALLVSGTTEVVMTPRYRQEAPGGELVVNPAISSLLPGATAVIGGSTGTVGGLLPFLAERFGCGSAADPARLEEEAAAIPAGAGGLTVYPALEGERHPRSIPGAAAAILGLGPTSGPGALARAVWEAGAYRLDGIIEEIRGGIGAVPGELWISGGGGANVLWNRIRADVTGIPLRPLPWTEASTIGATMIACGALGLREVIGGMAVEGQTRYTPDVNARERYGRLKHRYRVGAELLSRFDRENREDPE